MFRDVVRSVAKNTSIMFAQLLITWSSTFILMLFLPRYLGPVEYGRLFLATSISAIFGIFVQYGGTYLVAKDVSRSLKSTPQILVDAAGLRFIFGVIAFAGMVILSVLVDYTPEVRALLLIFGVGFLFQGSITVLSGCYQGHERMEYTAAGAIAERVFQSIVAVSALLMGAKAIVMAIVGVTGGLLNFLVLARFSRKVAPSLPKINWVQVSKGVRKGAPYFLFVVFSTIYFRIDSVMLSKMAPEEVVGWYGGAYKLFESLNFAPVIFSTALYPILSRMWKEKGDTHKRTTQKSLELVIIIAVPISIGVIAFAEKLIQLFYGLSQYKQSVLVLQLLACGFLFFFVDMILGTLLLSSDKQRHQSLLALFAIPVNVGLNYLMIPYSQIHFGNGGLGAAFSTGITELFIMLGMLSLVPRGILEGFRFSVVIKCVSAGVLMGGFVLSCSYLGLPWIVVALMSTVVYVTCIFVMRTFEPAEENFFRGTLTFKNLRNIKNSMKVRLTEGQPQH
jgi:O-antigen/teichoic acid export membrane protein